VVKDLLCERADTPIPFSQLMEGESPINWEELSEAEEWTNLWRRVAERHRKALCLSGVDPV
jgi:hypothetical protein